MEEMIAEIKEKQAEIKRLQKELQDKSSEIFLSAFKKLFEENPRLTSFSWNQYTPYFNDGDTCYFSANTDYIYVNGEDASDSDWLHEKNVISYTNSLSMPTRCGIFCIVKPIRIIYKSLNKLGTSFFTNNFHLI